MYESAPHYCIMISLMMLYLNREVSIGLCCFSYVQNIRNSFYEENGMQKRETREVDDSAPEMGLAAALKLRIFLSVCIFAAFLGCMYTHTDLCGYSTQTITEMICDNHYYTNLKNYVMIH